MGKKRIRHSGDFKAKVALEALKGLKPVNNELASLYQVRTSRSPVACQHTIMVCRHGHESPKSLEAAITVWMGCASTWPVTGNSR